VLVHVVKIVSSSSPHLACQERAERVGEKETRPKSLVSLSSSPPSLGTGGEKAGEKTTITDWSCLRHLSLPGEIDGEKTTITDWSCLRHLSLPGEMERRPSSLTGLAFVTSLCQERWREDHYHLVFFFVKDNVLNLLSFQEILNKRDPVNKNLMAWNIFSCLCISLEKRVGPLLKTGDRGQGRDRVTQLHEMEKKEEDHFTGLLLRSDHLSWNYSPVLHDRTRSRSHRTRVVT
jgi:hypothetical protein